MNPSNPLPLKTGDAVRITHDGQTVNGQCILASGNGQSAAIEFEAILGGYVGMMPILWKDGCYVDLITGAPVEIEIRKLEARATEAE